MNSRIQKWLINTEQLRYKKNAFIFLSHKVYICIENPKTIFMSRMDLAQNNIQCPCKTGDIVQYPCVFFISYNM